MGFIPLDGLVMATRSGAVDPGLLTWLEQQETSLPARWPGPGPGGHLATPPSGRAPPAPTPRSARRIPPYAPSWSARGRPSRSPPASSRHVRRVTADRSPRGVGDRHRFATPRLTGRTRPAQPRPAGRAGHAGHRGGRRPRRAGPRATHHRRGRAGTPEAQRRLLALGANAVRTHHAQPLRVLGRQLASPVLILLAVTATVSFFLGQRTDTIVIGVILLASVGLGFVNEYRAERATDALHSQVAPRSVVVRGGARPRGRRHGPGPRRRRRCALGEMVPADLRLLTTTGLQCDEACSPGSRCPRQVGRPGRGGLGVGRPDLVRIHGHRGSRRQRTSASWSPPAAARSSAASRSGSGSGSPRPTSRSGCAASRCCCCRSRSRSPSLSS